MLHLDIDLHIKIDINYYCASCMSESLLQHYSFHRKCRFFFQQNKCTSKTLQAGEISMMSGKIITGPKREQPQSTHWWVWAVVVIILLSLVGRGISMIIEEPKAAKNELSSPQETIKKAIKDHIEEEYTFTEITSIAINEDLGIDLEGDYIASVYLTWRQQNSGKTSKDVLSLYSDDLAATIAEQCKNVQELTVYWTVPYLSYGNAKCAYERKNGKMYRMDMIWDSHFH